MKKKRPAYYNDTDPFVAQWLRNLIKAGHIAPGDVDERSIEDVTPADLAPYAQCHFFAGLGGWSYALRQSGWDDDDEIWTGSCPCQPFSAAGEGAGFADERHLWPAFFHLIEQRRPCRVLGEQVAHKDADVWIDLVSADLETMGYAVAAFAFPAASLGAPHIRDRTYWLGHSGGSGLQKRVSLSGVLSRPSGGNAGQTVIGAGVCVGGLADADSAGRRVSGRGEVHSRGEPTPHTVHGDEDGGMGYTDGIGAGRIAGEVRSAEAGEGGRGCDHDAGTPGLSLSARTGATNGLWRDADRLDDSPSGWNIPCFPRGDQRGLSQSHGGYQRLDEPGPTNGFWRDADWLLCRDGKWRPVEPGSFPLVDGIPGRVGRLRAYGNAICAPQATAFCAAVREYESMLESDDDAL